MHGRLHAIFIKYLEDACTLIHALFVIFFIFHSQKQCMQIICKIFLCLCMCSICIKYSFKFRFAHDLPFICSAIPKQYHGAMPTSYIGFKVYGMHIFPWQCFKRALTHRKASRAA